MALVEHRLVGGSQAALDGDALRLRLLDNSVPLKRAFRGSWLSRLADLLCEQIIIPAILVFAPREDFLKYGLEERQ